jgi:hypothetical protein
MLFTLKILSSLSFPNITLIPLIYHSPHTYYFSLLLYITLSLTTHPSHPLPFFSQIPNPTHTHLLSLITHHTHLSSLIILISHHSSYSSLITHHLSPITLITLMSHLYYHLSLLSLSPFSSLITHSFYHSSHSSYSSHTSFINSSNPDPSSLTITIPLHSHPP